MWESWSNGFRFVVSGRSLDRRQRYPVLSGSARWNYDPDTSAQRNDEALEDVAGKGTSGAQAAMRSYSLVGVAS